MLCTRVRSIQKEESHSFSSLGQWRQHCGLVLLLSFLSDHFFSLVGRFLPPHAEHSFWFSLLFDINYNNEDIYREKNTLSNIKPIGRFHASWEQTTLQKKT